MTVNVSMQYGPDALRYIAIEIDAKLQGAFDTKNKEVASLRRDVDRHIRTVGKLERRALMVASRRKFRRAK